MRVAARLFTASEALRAEQRATEAQASRPSAPPPAYPAALATRTDQALDEAFKAYDAASATGANLSPVALRQAVEARRAARGGPAGGAWRVAEDRLAQVVEADAAAALKPTLSDPFLAEMIRVRQMSWAAFLGAQADQAQAEATTPSGTPATTRGLDRGAADLAEVRTRWALVDDEARLPTTPPELKAAILAANQAFFVDRSSRPARAETDAAPIAKVAEVAARLTEAAKRTSQAAADTVGPIVLLVAALVLSGTGFLLIFARLVQPIAVLTATMRRVAEGDLDSPIPFRGQADEIGDLAQALEMFRNSAVERLRVESELLKAQAEAAAANDASRLKSQFLANISHEIRTPLNGVLGMTQVMARDELSSEQRDRLQVVQQSGEALLALLNDLLDLARIEAGKLVLESTEFDLTELLNGVRATFSGIAETRNLAFDLVIEDAAAGIYRGDPTRVRQILFNLVSNALKFTPAGSVRIEVSRSRGRLRIAVADTGIGMSKAAVGRLFESFVQAEASTSRRFGGSGLGLSICRELVDLMGGAITAKSQEGQGSAFTVTLPLKRLSAGDKASAPVATGSDGGGFWARKPAVLAAEDNATNALVLRTLLEQLGLDVEVVENGALALEAWRAKSWDLILMDVQMPVMDGPTATRAIRDAERASGRVRTPIIALTANTMSHQVGAYMAAGMDDYVSKPFSVAGLMSAVETALSAFPAEGSEDDAAEPSSQES